jgi:hypothetical protein
MADYHDGPRGGIADFDGRPHAYSSVFDHEGDEYADTFDLVPVDDETLQLALEAWAISTRWWRAYLAGEPVPSGPRLLPSDRARHDELVPVLRAQIPRTPSPVAWVTGPAMKPARYHALRNSGRPRSHGAAPLPPIYAVRYA